MCAGLVTLRVLGFETSDLLPQTEQHEDISDLRHLDVLGWLRLVCCDSRHQICCHKLNNMKTSVIRVISMFWAGYAWYVVIRDITFVATN